MGFEHGALLLESLAISVLVQFLPVPEATRGLGERWLVWPGEEPPTLLRVHGTYFHPGQQVGGKRR